MDDINLQPALERRSKVAERQATKGEPSTGQDDLASDKVDRRLSKACADFEAIFVEQLFKTMRASVPDSKLLNGGRAEELYTAMLDQQVAEQMTHGQGSIGLADQMQNRLAHYLMTATVTKTK